MARILIADDHAVVRRGLRDILIQERDLDVAGVAEDYPALLSLVAEGGWDAIIMDIKMPGGSVLEALGRIRSIAPELPVLVLSVHPEDQFAVRLLAAGAAGYLTKDSAPDELVEAVRALLAGRKFVSSALGGALAAGLGKEGSGPLHARLSDREFQVLVGIASGKTVSVIAEELYLSVKTVSTYRTRLLEKMGMDSNAELTRYALEAGLL